MKLNVECEDLKDLIKLGHLVSQYVVGMEGNISKKTNRGFLIKGSGSKLFSLTETDFVEYDVKLNQLNNFEKKGSMELGFHSFLLQYPEINYVCHTHPTNTLKILCSKFSKKFSETRLFPDQVVFNGEKSCLIDYKKPGDDLCQEISKKFKEFISFEKKMPKLILLKNHGIITFGKTIDECYISTQICEKSAEIFTTFMGNNNLNKLSKIEISDLLNDNNEKYRQSLL
jgi:ribulose-5-phosphate 4-epimerase/fuculose-1-phosphate aldolase